MNEDNYTFATGKARAELAAGLVGYALGVAGAEVLTPVGRGSRLAALARQVVMYLMATAFGMSLSRVASVLSRDRSAVANALRQIEQRREDARFDAWLGWLERSLRAAPPPPRAEAAVEAVAP